MKTNILYSMLILSSAALFLFCFFRLLYNPERQKVGPLCGVWVSVADGCTTLDIFRRERVYYMTIRRAGSGTTVRLRYKYCIHFLDEKDRRTDIFYASHPEALLLAPGGSFKRISKPYENER